ncbi:unnamed protein product [Bursaphelenchus xylophilus]|uniref:(pine wood nematode) hypothetical protein n=1 Tax=Bursaphelenchus xylophilus TaxID=6326 RepID=A0A7I8WNQ4_BURXY|nr:unnamed protein product [Bursaphelenchus xylophilus]CAG9093564.1 unnamed protein product [Bursaphelenchus xylophilus]
MTLYATLVCLSIGLLMLQASDAQQVDGLAPIAIDNAEVVALTEKSFKQFNADKNGAYTFKKIKSAKSQEAEGTMYQIDYIVAKGKDEECVRDNAFVAPFTKKDTHDFKKCE